MEKARCQGLVTLVAEHASETGAVCSRPARWASTMRSGTLKVGDTLVFSPNHKTSVVASIEKWNAPQTDSATAGRARQGRWNRTIYDG
jgi:sulfate adenylyltransferase subunit 1 (EFTu-like GTPase family)